MLGEGAFGKVYECIEKKTQSVFAVKVNHKIILYTLIKPNKS